MPRIALLVLIFTVLSGCTEEQRNKLSRQTDNLIGLDFTVSYIDEGKVVKKWTVRDGKITSGKGEDGSYLGYYYFWTEETGYVQTPIDRTVIEELRR